MNTLRPILHPKAYVFCIEQRLDHIPMSDILMTFRESEGMTMILDKETADRYNLEYNYTAAWISLSIQTSLELVGLTALFSAALAKEKISCNVVAAYHHDHIFVDIKDAEKAMHILGNLKIDLDL